MTVTGRAATLLASLLVLSAAPGPAGAAGQAPFQDPPPATRDPTRGPYATDFSYIQMNRLRHQHQLRAAVRCVVLAWNAYDADAARKCYEESAVAVWKGERKAIDWELERRLREFDAAVSSWFAFEILDAQYPRVEFTLSETNQLISALGLKSVTARWRYTVDDSSQIVEEELIDADQAFNAALRDFTRWAREQRPVGLSRVTDPKGNLRFDGASAPTLVALAREWLRSRGKSATK